MGIERECVVKEIRLIVSKICKEQNKAVLRSKFWQSDWSRRQHRERGHLIILISVIMSYIYYSWDACYPQCFLQTIFNWYIPRGFPCPILMNGIITSEEGTRSSWSSKLCKKKKKALLIITIDDQSHGWFFFFFLRCKRKGMEHWLYTRHKRGFTIL